MAGSKSEQNRDESVVRRVTLRDIEDLKNPVRGMAPEHVQLGSGRFHGEILMSFLGSSTLNIGEYDAPLRIANGAFSNKTATLVFSLSDTPDNVMNGFALTSKKLLVFPEGCDHHFRMQGKMKWLVVEVAFEEINKYAKVLHRREIGTLGTHSWALSLDPRSQFRFRRAISDLRLTFRTTPAWLERERNRKRLHEIFMDTLATSFLSLDSGARISLAPRRTNMWRIFKSAEEYIRSHSSSDMSIGDLCRATNSSKSNLYRAFQDYLGHSPHEFLTRRRLNNARRLLRSASKNSTTVATIAMECGFAHLGRFSSYYKRLYGEYPKETLAR